MESRRRYTLRRSLLMVLFYLSQSMFWLGVGGASSRHTRLILLEVLYGVLIVVMVPALTLAVQHALSLRREAGQ